MKKNLLFPIDLRLKERAKRNARSQRVLFSQYSETIYENGVKLQEFCKCCGVTESDVFFYLESCTNATIIKRPGMKH